MNGAWSTAARKIKWHESGEPAKRAAKKRNGISGDAGGNGNILRSGCQFTKTGEMPRKR